MQHITSSLPSALEISWRYRLSSKKVGLNGWKLLIRTISSSRYFTELNRRWKHSQIQPTLGPVTKTACPAKQDNLWLSQVNTRWTLFRNGSQHWKRLLVLFIEDPYNGRTEDYPVSWCSFESIAWLEEVCVRSSRYTRHSSLCLGVYNLQAFDAGVGFWSAR